VLLDIKRNVETVEISATVVVEGGFHDSLPARKSFGVGEAHNSLNPQCQQPAFLGNLKLNIPSSG
jgi:hypothetical protein